MEITASSKFDLASITALCRVEMFGKTKPKNKIILFVVTYGILFAAVLAGILFLEPMTEMYVMLGVIVAVFLVYGYLYFFVPKLRYNALAKMKEAEIHYVFGDDTVKISTKAGDYNSETEVGYSVFFRAFETSRYFFLFQTKNQVILVDKAAIQGGSAEQIREKFAPLLGKRYCVCKY